MKSIHYCWREKSHSPPVIEEPGAATCTYDECQKQDTNSLAPAQSQKQYVATVGPAQVAEPGRRGLFVVVDPQFPLNVQSVVAKEWRWWQQQQKP